MLLGWYGISGAATVPEQMPFLASATAPGLALVVAGAVLMAGDRTRRNQDRAFDELATLYRLLTAAVESGSAGAANVADHPAMASSGIVSVAGGTRYHRPGCALVAGKATVDEVDGTAVGARHLEPCPICEPPAPAS